jgi:hypothetical protein
MLIDNPGMTAVHASQEYASVACQGGSTSAVDVVPSGKGIPTACEILASSLLPRTIDIDKDGIECDACDNTQERGYGELDLSLPRCALPPAEELEEVEALVESAVREQDGLPEAAVPAKSYKALIGAIQTKKNLDVLRKILIAFRTSGRGSTLHLLTGSKKHARVIHSVLRLNPFELPASNSTANGTSGPTGAATQLLQTRPDYELANAQLHFLSAVVSANATFLVPTLTFAWKLLTSPPYENVPVERYLCCFKNRRKISTWIPAYISNVTIGAVVCWFSLLVKGCNGVTLFWPRCFASCPRPSPSCFPF